MNKLDTKFRHSRWYKGTDKTKREILAELHKNLDVWLSEKPSLKQSGYLFHDIKMDKVLTDGRCFYRLKDYELEYYLSL